ncbi:hypothetical protein MTO96_035946 [Rhipicephalus appendiculatus]
MINELRRPPAQFLSAARAHGSRPVTRTHECRFGSSARGTNLPRGHRRAVHRDSSVEYTDAAGIRLDEIARTDAVLIPTFKEPREAED